MNFLDTTLGQMHVKWAQWALTTFFLRFPKTRPVLYLDSSALYICIDDVDSDIQNLASIFDNEIRPLTANIRLVTMVPSGATEITNHLTLEEESWLAGQAITTFNLQKIMSMSVPDFPIGSIDFDNTKDKWIFSSPSDLNAEERDLVIKAKEKLGLPGDLIFSQIAIPPEGVPLGAKIASLPRESPLILISAREMRQFPVAIKKMVEKDEDEWRYSVSRRIDLASKVGAGADTSHSSCLFSPEYGGELKLSELLSLYDVIYLMPSKEGSDWIQENHLTLADMRMLLEMERIRLVFPYSIEHYPYLFSLLEDISSDSIILSRCLAGKVVEKVAPKDPVLYAPLSNSQRSQLLSALHGIGDPFSNALVNSYSRHFQGQNAALLHMGATASLGYGVGAHIGDLIHSRTGKDARLELSTAGAGVEWAIGLGAAYIPRSYGHGYDETHNSLIVASYMSRTKMVPADPVASRLHTVADGLLSLSGIPPLEIAKNFNSSAAAQFRRYSARLANATADVNELRAIVTAINEDTLKFERRSDRISRLKIDALLVGIAAKPLGDLIDNQMLFGSVAAAWIYELMKDKIPSAFSDKLSEISQIILSILTSSSPDAVIVSRARQAMHKKL
ncbi:hypothetical protein CAter282_2299 [Collimonas arenae]|uniref:Uncharacterized protein n=1 Tax=Collimonas arenae TaxID=279058 RepID=A0A127PQQ8_9BURK|nr:hypothetical protein [Collimonas arenae]AMP00147.1 hypothetical protein CAter10_2501 [Collimonas arenae]AMP10049.1 hypothetical protein CAter282_2299 [Collimonas arenae]